MRTTFVVIAALLVVGAILVGLRLFTGRPAGHKDHVHCVAFSPDGKRIVSGSGDGTVKVWDAHSGEQTLALPRVSFRVYSVAFRSDGNRILAAGTRTTARETGGAWAAFDAASGKQVFTMGGLPEVRKAVCSPDGAHFVTGHADGTIVVWDADGGRRVREVQAHPKNEVDDLAYSPDGKRLASASSDKIVKVWEADSGKEILTLDGHKDHVHCVAFSPDGKRVASGGREKAIIVWDVGSGKEIRALRGHKGSIHALTFSPDGKRIVSVSGMGLGPDTTVPGEIKVWDVEGGREVLSVTGHKGTVHGVAFSPDGKRFVTGGGGSGPERRPLGSLIAWGEIKVWDAESGAEALSLGSR